MSSELLPYKGWQRRWDLHWHFLYVPKEHELLVILFSSWLYVGAIIRLMNSSWAKGCIGNKSFLERASSHKTIHPCDLGWVTVSSLLQSMEKQKNCKLVVLFLNHKLLKTPFLACSGCVSLPRCPNPCQHWSAAWGTVRRPVWNMNEVQTERDPVWPGREFWMESDTLKALWRLSIYEALCVHKVNFNHFSSKKTISLVTHVFVLWLMPQTWTAACKKGDIFMHLRSIFNAIVKEEQEFWTHIRESWSGPSWSGLPFPSPGDLPNPGIEPGCLALPADSLPSEPPGRLQSLPCKPVVLSYGACGSSGSPVDRQLCKVTSLAEPLVTLRSSSFHKWLVGLCVEPYVWDDQMTGLTVIMNMCGWEDHTN